MRKTIEKYRSGKGEMEDSWKDVRIMCGHAVRKGKREGEARGLSS